MRADRVVGPYNRLSSLSAAPNEVPRSHSTPR